MEASRDKEDEGGVDILRGMRQVETSSTVARTRLHVVKRGGFTCSGVNTSESMGAILSGEKHDEQQVLGYAAK
jgi:hypothetical protein